MRIVITGCYGFLASHLEKFLYGREHEVVGVGRNSNTKACSRTEWEVESNLFNLDFANDDLTEAFDKADVIIHAGAKTFVDFSIRDAKPFIESNIVGTFKVLEAARKVPTLKKLIYISTDEVYGPTPDGISFHEGTRFNPGNPYSATKAAADLLCQAYHNTYDIPLNIVRMENLYGTFQWPTKVIPVWTNQALKGEKLKIYGDGLHTRQWLNVSDACRGIIKVMDSGINGEAYNISSSEEYTNIELAMAINEICGADPRNYELIDDTKIRPGHDRAYRISNKKILWLGWKPIIPFREGLEMTIAWYKNNKRWLS